MSRHGVTHTHRLCHIWPSDTLIFQELSLWSQTVGFLVLKVSRILQEGCIFGLLFSHQRRRHVPDAPSIIVQSHELLRSAKGWQRGASTHHTHQPMKSECLQVKGMPPSWWLLEEAQFLALLSQECPLLTFLSNPQSRSQQGNRAGDQGGGLLSGWVLHRGVVCPDIRISSAAARVGLERWTSAIVAVQLLSCVWLFATPWTAAHQASLPFIISQSLLRFMSTESVMPSNHLILCHPFSSRLQSFPASRYFPMSQLFSSGGQSTGASASASVLPMNTHGWFSLGWTYLIFLQSKELSKSFLQHHDSKASVPQQSAFVMVQLSHLYMTTGKIIALSIQAFVGKCLPINSTEKELKYTFLFPLTPLLLRGNMSDCQHLYNDRAHRYQFGSLISHENLQDETSFLIVIFCCDESPGGKGAFIICSLRAEVCDASVCAFQRKTDWPVDFHGAFTLFRKDSHCGGGYGESPQELKVHPHSKEFLL